MNRSGIEHRLAGFPHHRQAFSSLGQWPATEGIELLNQGKIRTSGENVTYKYLRILEVDTIKQAKMKEKKLKSVSQKNQKTT